MLKANKPGCGTSFICEGSVDLSYEVLCFICPTNKLVQNYEAAIDKITSATMHTSPILD